MRRKFAHHADWFIVGLYAGLIIGLLMLWVGMSYEVTTSHTIAQNDLDEYFINYDLEVLKIDLLKNYPMITTMNEKLKNLRI